MSLAALIHLETAATRIVGSSNLHVVPTNSGTLMLYFTNHCRITNCTGTVPSPTSLPLPARFDNEAFRHR